VLELVVVGHLLSLLSLLVGLGLLARLLLGLFLALATTRALCRGVAAGRTVRV
jgi:hypothetical protein